MIPIVKVGLARIAISANQKGSTMLGPQIKLRAQALCKFPQHLRRICLLLLLVVESHLFLPRQNLSVPNILNPTPSYSLSLAL